MMHPKAVRWQSIFSIS